MTPIRRTTTALLMLAAFAIPIPAVAGAAPGPAWETDVDRAFAAARAADKPLLVDLTAAWCGWCKTLAREVFPDPRFVELAKGYVLLRVDVEDGAGGTELAGRHHVESLPTMLVLEPSGARRGEVRGFSPPERYVQQIRAVEQIWQKVLAAYQATLSSSDTDRLRRTAIDFYQRRDGERAVALLDRLLALETPSGSDGAWLRYFLADSLRMAGDYQRARGALTAAAEAAHGVSDPELGERLALFSFWLARDEARCAEAERALASFEHDHPRSDLLAGAHLALDELRSGAATCS